MTHAPLRRQGRIATIGNGSMQIVFDAETACTACAGRALCQGKRPPVELSLPLRAGAQAGDPVDVEIPRTTLHAAAALAWLAPAAALLAGALAGQALGGSDATAMLGSGLGLALGLGLSARLARLLATHERCRLV